MADVNVTIVQPQVPAESAPAPASNPDRYELLDELARGGMGVVYRARDRVLNRIVGLKTLISTAPSEAVAARFRAEAHITGQLQHPNIPPVHDLGTLPDGRPFLAMKLIKGDTLDVLLKARPDPAHDRGRFVAVFEHIAQGVAYAHAHNVIHRDLKPLNVMVGAFGEVQVMDWGLAKVLAAPQPSERTEADAPAPTLVTAPTDDIDRTRAGSVMGTPAYMPREQAIGAIDQLDARSDVFSLGGILCTILTGKPPYVGDSAETTHQLAAVAKLDDAFARLNACGAEPALIDLCKWCLQADSKDRPKNADVVVVAVAVLRTEAERRARQAEVDRVRAEGEREAAEAQSFAFRKQRQLQLALLLGVLFLVAVGTSFALYRRDVQTAQERAENELLLLRMGDENRQQIVSRDARVGVTANLKLATDLRKQYKFKQAEVALAQAAELARKVNIQDMRRVKEEVVQAQRELTFVVRLDDIRYRKWVWHAEEGGKGRFLTKHTAGDYRAAFVAFNLDLTALEPPVAATYIAAREAHREIVAAVDDWALHEPDAALCARLLDVARLTAPDPWLDKLRNPKLRQDPVALDKMATELDMTRVPPSVLATLATLMERQTLDPTPLLVRARSRYPDEFELAFQQGLWSLRFGGQGIGALEAARALRPDNLAVLVNLGGALFYGNKLEEARIALDRAIELAPQSADAHRNLGTLHTKTRDRTGAMRAFDTAISLDPQDVFSRISRGLLHLQNNEVEPALLLGRAAVAIDPLVAEAHALVGFALASKGDFSGARAAFAEVGRLDPKFAAQLPRIPFPVAPPPRPK